MEDGNKEQYVPLSELDKIIAERVSAALREQADEHAKNMAAALQQANPGNLVPAHAGGPGHGRHQRSWSLAEQEAAARGEVLDHWT